MLTMRTAEKRDISLLAPRLRTADLETIKAASGSTPEEALTFGLLTSDKCWVLEDEHGTVLSMLGIGPRDPVANLRCVWMLCADLKNPMQLLRSSRVVVEWLVLKYGHLFNWEDSRCPDHVRWLRWCGFKFPGIQATFEDPLVPFLYFTTGDTPCPPS